MNIMFILEVVVSLLLFIIIKLITYYLTTIKGMPAILDYQPWNCHKCCQFWTLITAYPTLYIFTNTTYTTFLVYGVSFAILDAIAMYINENNTVSIEDIKDVEQ